MTKDPGYFVGLSIGVFHPGLENKSICNRVGYRSVFLNWIAKHGKRDVAAACVRNREHGWVGQAHGINESRHRAGRVSHIIIMVGGPERDNVGRTTPGVRSQEHARGREIIEV